MKNIFIFIYRYFTFLSFLLLQVIALVMLSSTSKTHETFFSAFANEATGRINTEYSGFREYFTLKETNKLLTEENARLKNGLVSNFFSVEEGKKYFVDSLVKDTLGHFRKYTYLPARVVGNTYTLQTNFILLERGSEQGVKKGMAVVGSTGIVGVVVETTPNYCKAMSLLHRNSKVSAMLKKDHTTGSLEWDGADPSYLILKNVTKGAKVMKGDTVLTSTYSSNFPSGLMIGTIADINSDPASNFYSLKIKTATNFFSIQYVYLIENTRYIEQVQLENNLSKNP